MSEKGIQIYTCKSCGRNYMVRKCEVRYSATDTYRHYCILCQKAHRAKRERERAEHEDLLWQRKKAEAQQKFENLLCEWNLKDLNEIRPSSEKSLFIIGNGFDLMHGVKSSYYAFRDSLGKHSPLRTQLETFWTPEDIWADLENGLAHFNMDAMGSRFTVNNWLEIFDAYDENAKAADFFAASENAAAPMIEVAEKLPRRLRRWIETLTIGTDDRPLQNLIRAGKVLNFNYTEFVEKLYGIPAKDICYIHGCRRNKMEKLILGHRPGASEQSYELNEKQKQRKPTYRNYLIESAQDQVFHLVSEHDRELTKDCDEIINAHESFFKSLKNIRDVFVIGHSMSQVDWDYFRKIACVVDDLHNVTWYFGCHGLNDLNNMTALVEELKIEKKNIVIFRTDTIQVRISEVMDKNYRSGKKVPERILAESADKRWRIIFSERTFRIIDLTGKNVPYEVLMSPDVRKAFFDKSGKNLFVIIRGVYPGVLLFSYRNDIWTIVNELEGIPNQGILNSRLRNVYLSENRITFVYNNRVRRYDFENGLLTENIPIRNAPAGDYTNEGRDVSRYFIRQ